jgi:hypothetical protein
MERQSHRWVPEGRHWPSGLFHLQLKAANVPRVKAPRRGGFAGTACRPCQQQQGYILEATIRDSRGLKRRIGISCRSAELEGFEDCGFSDVREWSWFWSCRHSRAPHLARALSLGLRSEAPRSPVSMLVERLVGSGRKRGRQGPGPRREKNRPDGLAGRRPSSTCCRRNEGSPDAVGIAIIIG